MSSFPSYRWNQHQQYQTPQREPHGFDNMAPTFSLNAERRRLRSAGTPLPTRHQQNISWAKKWRGAPSPVPTPPVAGSSPTPPGAAQSPAPSPAPLGEAQEVGESYLERDVIKCKRDLLDRRSQTAGSSRAKLTKTEGILGGGWVGGSSGSGKAAPQAQGDDGGSDESLEDVRVTLSNKRMEEVNGKMRERHNSWVKQHWKQEQPKPSTRHEELLQMFRPRKGKAGASPSGLQQHSSHYGGMLNEEATRVLHSDFPPRPKSASAARSSESMRERDSASEDREWLERVEREREKAFASAGGVNASAASSSATASASAAASASSASRLNVQSAASDRSANDASSQDSFEIGSFKTAFDTASSAEAAAKGDAASSRLSAASPSASTSHASGVGSIPVSDKGSSSAGTASAGAGGSQDASSKVEAEEQQRITTMVQKLKSEGNAAYQCGRYSVAIQCYNKALEHDSHNVALHCNRAAAFLMLRYFDRCLADCQTAINIGPHYAKAHFRAGKALLLQCQPRAARRYYQTALQLVRQQNPHRQDMELIAMEERIEADLKAVTYVEQCRNYADQSKWPEALHAAEMAGEAVKEDAMQQLRLWALTYVDPVMARVELGHLVSLTQRHIEATNETNRGHLQQSNDTTTRLLGVNPMVLADQLALLGRASFFSGHLYVSAAAQRLKEALTHVPDHRESTQLLRFVNSFEINNREASSHYRSGQWAEAYQSYTNCLNLDPANKKLKSVTYNNRAAALLMMGNAAEAVKDCTAAINEDYTNVKAYARRSHAHQDLGNIDAAIRDLELAAQLNPSYQQELKEVQRKRDAMRAAASSSSTPFECAGGGGGGGAAPPPGQQARPGSRPSSAAGSRPASAGASRRSSYGHGGGGGAAGGGSSQTNSNFINNFPSAAVHTSANNYYKLMGLDRNASGPVVMKKYKELALRYHPDRCKNDEARPYHEKMFKEIGEARTVLSDGKLRSEYDMQLACNSLR